MLNINLGDIVKNNLDEKFEIMFVSENIIGMINIKNHEYRSIKKEKFDSSFSKTDLRRVQEWK